MFEFLSAFLWVHPFQLLSFLTVPPLLLNPIGGAPIFSGTIVQKPTFKHLESQEEVVHHTYKGLQIA
jgi:hypothetical protein